MGGLAKIANTVIWYPLVYEEAVKFFSRNSFTNLLNQALEQVRTPTKILEALESSCQLRVVLIQLGSGHYLALSSSLSSLDSNRPNVYLACHE